jgi:uncharacterized heparinase superfamily protein
MKLLLYYRTIKYLKLRQIVARLRLPFTVPKPDFRAAPLQRNPSGRWTPPVPKPQSLLSPTRFRFLNFEEDIQIPGDWNSDKISRLWLYNLHYFDFINSMPAPDAAGQVMDRWIAENPPAGGAGWEPYPLSLRMVNWIKYLLAEKERSGGSPRSGPTNSAKIRQSLAVQTRFLFNRLEYHLRANHLLTNAKALIFAGLFFEGREAQDWLSKGLSILDEELDEQILADGGHFERSPLYHSIILEDLLDLVNGDAAYPCVIDPALTARCRKYAAKMLGWLCVMSHPDGQFALFNDAAFGIAAEPEDLSAYAERLGVNVPAASPAPLVRLADSGYLRAAAGPLTLLVDAGPLGPDYQPGHGHADTLSFELSCHDSRIIVDSGTSTYAADAQRLLERSTGAHNTLEINGRSSSEVWKSFRVARRAKVTECRAQQNADGAISIAAAHDGYRRIGCGLHTREFVLSDNGLEIKDTMAGKKRVILRLFFHFHPGIVLEKREKNIVDVLGKGGRHLAFCEIEDLFKIKIEPFDYHPLFGLSLPSYRIVCATEAKLPFACSTVISCAETA